MGRSRCASAKSGFAGVDRGSAAAPISASRWTRLVEATVHFAPGYQQASHMVVHFFRTGVPAENQRMRSRSEPSVTDPDLELGGPDLALDWQENAACLHHAGRVDFFPARGESVRDAKAVCAVCPVKNECLDFALRLKVAHGVWGGLSERERRNLRRDRHRGTLRASR